MSSTPLKSRVHVLILQHPQEPDKELGTAKLTHETLSNSTLRVGLSWPNLRAARYGKEEKIGLLSPSRWAVLYLGTGESRATSPSTAGVGSPVRKKRPLTLVDKKGAPLLDSDQLLAQIDGIVVLDGTWSQAKALWWRNAWLLKLRRAVLSPEAPSLYGTLRKEPRTECVSTLESVALALATLEKKPALESALTARFETFLRDLKGSMTPQELKARFTGKAPKTQTALPADGENASAPSAKPPADPTKPKKRDWRKRRPRGRRP